MARFFNDTIHKHLRKSLRNEMTEPEQTLWAKLRGDQLGYRFRRQYGVGRYIIDFYCPRLRLAVEIDGDSHSTESARAYDAERDAALASAGIVTLRFSNNVVRENIQGLLEQLCLVCQQRAKTLPPSPSSQEGG